MHYGPPVDPDNHALTSIRSLAVALTQLSCTGFHRLLLAVDIDCNRLAQSLERIAIPDHQICKLARFNRADQIGNPKDPRRGEGNCLKCSRLRKTP